MAKYKPLTRKQLWTIWISLNEMQHQIGDLMEKGGEGLRPIDRRATKAKELIQKHRIQLP